MGAQEPPEDIMNAIRAIRRLRGKQYPTREDKFDLNRAKLRVAYWACRSEDVIASRENLSYVLGEDAADIMSAYDRYLETAKDSPEGTRPTDPRFWGGA